MRKRTLATADVAATLADLFHKAERDWIADTDKRHKFPNTYPTAGETVARRLAFDSVARALGIEPEYLAQVEERRDWIPAAGPQMDLRCAQMRADAAMERRE